MNTTIEYLQPLNSTQKSFYKEAVYHKTETKSSINYRLYSYQTAVLDIVIPKNDTLDSYYIVNDYTDYSMTTIKHVKEMLLQFLPNYDAMFNTSGAVPIRKILEHGLTEKDLTTVA